ncbi:MAG: rRNA maturation RNase YbeY, partial [Clostridia bacterium]|nr:rRNA maturation RNase YbeY [Clostridia bacterium]
MLVREAIEATLDYEQYGNPCEVSVSFVDNAEIRDLNKKFRGIDKATDVLSFPMCDFETPGDFDALEETPEEYFNPDTGELILGDIIISVDKVAEQSENYGHSKKREFAFLVAH